MDGLSLAEGRGLGRAAGGEDELGLERRGRVGAAAAALLALPLREAPGDDGRGDGARADHADGGSGRRSLVHILLVSGRFSL